MAWDFPVTGQRIAAVLATEFHELIWSRVEGAPLGRFMHRPGGDGG